MTPAKLSAAELNVFRELLEFWETQHGAEHVKKLIASHDALAAENERLAAELAEAKHDAAGWKRSFESQNGEIRKLSDAMADHEDAIERLRDVGKAIGCGHVDNADERLQIVRCVEETVSKLEAELAAAQQRLAALAVDPAKREELGAFALREQQSAFSEISRKSWEHIADNEYAQEGWMRCGESLFAAGRASLPEVAELERQLAEATKRLAELTKPADDGELASLAYVAYHKHLANAEGHDRNFSPWESLPEASRRADIAATQSVAARVRAPLLQQIAELKAGLETLGPKVICERSHYDAIIAAHDRLDAELSTTMQSLAAARSDVERLRTALEDALTCVPACLTRKRCEALLTELAKKASPAPARAAASSLPQEIADAGQYGSYAGAKVDEQRICGSRTANPAASEPSDDEQAICVPAALEALTDAFKADEDFAWGWHCNLACAAIDEGIEHGVANRIASRFMKLAFKVDTKEPAASEPIGLCPKCGIQPLTKEGGDMIRLGEKDYLCGSCKRYLCRPIEPKGAASEPNDSSHTMETAHASSSQSEPASVWIRGQQYVWKFNGAMQYLEMPFALTAEEVRGLYASLQVVECGKPADHSGEANEKVAHHSETLNLDHSEARALHRIVRAMHGGECPRCHVLTNSEAMLKTSPGSHCCPHCGFSISVQESSEVLTIFGEFMERNLAIFEKWRASRKVAGKAAENAEPAERRFVCPRCGCEQYGTYPPYPFGPRTSELHYCANETCNWSGSVVDVLRSQTAEVEAAKGKVAAGEGDRWNAGTYKGKPLGNLTTYLSGGKPFQQHIDDWFASNQRAGQEHKYQHGVFPLGMVGGWIDRADRAEQQLAAANQAREAAGQRAERAEAAAAAGKALAGKIRDALCSVESLDCVERALADYDQALSQGEQRGEGR